MRGLGREALYSAFLHGVLFVILVFGVPEVARDVLRDEAVLEVELVAESDLEAPQVSEAPVVPASAPQKEAYQEAVEDIAKEVAPAPLEQKKVVEKKKPIKVVKQKKPVEPIDAKPRRKPKPPVKTVAKVKQPTPKPSVVDKKPTPKKDAFASVLSSVDKLSQDVAKKQQFSTGARFSRRAPVSGAVVGAIRGQISQHWSVDGGARDADKLAVKLRIIFAMDGTIQSVGIVDQVRYQRDSFFRAAADRAVMAVQRTGRVQGLPVAEYDGWKDVTLTFDPRF